MSDDLKGRNARQLPILGQRGPEGVLPMDRRQALKVMAIAAAAPTVASCAPEVASDPAAIPAPASNPRAAGTAWDPLAALVFCGPTKAAYTIINGQVIVAKGTLQTMDMGALLDKHQSLSADLMLKSGFAG